VDAPYEKQESPELIVEIDKYDTGYCIDIILTYYEK
jgi:hypothetical protein